MGKNGKLEQKVYGIFQSTETRFEPGKLGSRAFARPYLAHLVLGGINEQLYQQTKAHVPRAFSTLCLLIPQLPALCLLELFLTAWSSGLGPGMDESIGAGWYHSRLWLQMSRLSGGAARSKAILFLAHFASTSSS